MTGVQVLGGFKARRPRRFSGPGRAALPVSPVRDWFFPVAIIFDLFGNASTTAAGSCFRAIAVPEPEQQISAVSFAVL